jgi:glycosyltransferase involved in cell wall biosynthesis
VTAQPRYHGADDVDEATTGRQAQRMRACMISFYFAPHYSGSAIQARNLSRYLQRRGIGVQVVSANLTGSPASEVLDGIHLFRLPVLRSGPWQVPSFLLGLAVFLIRNRRNYEVVHAHGTFQHVTASLVARLLGKKSLLKVAMAGSDIAFARQGRLWGRFNRFLVNRFDQFIATSKVIQREFAEHGFGPDRVHLIPNGVDMDVYRPPDSAQEKRDLRARLKLADKPTVCFVGIVNARKNVDFVLRVWRQVRAHGVVGQLLIVGPLPAATDVADYRYYQELQEFVAKEAMQHSVIFTGFQPDVASYLRASDLFLFPSRQEGMPNALLEAMAVGLPSVASRISGTEDLIEQGKSGFMFPLDDEPAFARTVADLLRDPATARRVGAAAKRFVEASYSLGAVAERYEEIYRRLLDR